MRIAFIGQKGIPGEGGGVEKHVEELSTRLVQHGHEAIVYTRPNYTDKRLKEYRGVKLISLPSVATKNLDAISHTILACLDLIFRKRKVDIIHFHSIGPSSLIWLVKIFKPRTPVISTFHSQCYLHKKWGVFARLYLKSGELASCKLADKTVVISESLKKLAKSKYSTSAEYIPSGAAIKERVAIHEIEKKWGLREGGYILTVSRLLPVKGIHYLIKAYGRIKTDKKLVIAGGGVYTDKYINQLKALAKDNDNIIFTGNLSGEILDELYSNAYLFIQPSEIEGLSVALLEAMSFGLPVLTSDIPENMEAVGGAGLLFKNKDIKDLENQLIYAFNNPDLIREKAKEAKERVKKYYNWDVIVGEIIRVYNEALELKSDSSFRNFILFRVLSRAFRK